MSKNINNAPLIELIKSAFENSTVNILCGDIVSVSENNPKYIKRQYAANIIRAVEEKRKSPDSFENEA